MNIELTIVQNHTSKQWHPASLTWQEFVENAQEPATEKDCGAYMAGKATSKNRKDSQVEYRTMVTLDADHADHELPARVERLGLTSLVHSTYSHTTDNPRYRIIIPLIGPGLTEEEYPRAARGLMEALGKEQFDPTCDQPKRLMYGPSAANPDQYEVYSYEGKSATAQSLLEHFGGFSTTPEHKRGPKQNPYNLPGVIGAFNRLYDMKRAVKEFNLPYEQVGDNRWHYTNAKSSGGVCVYPDGYVYSNHASDPVGGRALSMFDLVAMHRFADLDEAADTPLNIAPKDRPSIQKAMQEFTELPDVKAEMMGLNIESPDKGTSDWVSKLHIHPKTGKTLDDGYNWRLIVENDPVLAGLAYNTMSLATVTRQDFPWRKVTPGKNDQLTEADHEEISDHLECTYNMRYPSERRLNGAINKSAQKRAFHPVEDYLNGLEWDGVSRIETWLPCAQNAYTQRVARLVAIQAVARALDPGVKVDNCLILSGGEGLGKTRFIETMSRGWNTQLGSIEGGSLRDTIMNMSKSWITISDEGVAMKKADADALKQFITLTHDNVRLPYARETVELPRRQVIWGTTNNAIFLRAQEGNRRFLVVEVTKKVDMYPDEYVDQVWAEAVHIWKESRAKYGVRNNPDLYLSDEEESLAKDVRVEATEEEPLVGLIQDYLDTLVPENWESLSVEDRISWLRNADQGLVKPGTRRIERVCSYEIWAVLLGNTRGKMSRVDSLEIGEALRKISGWESSGAKRMRFRIFGQQRYFSRVEEEPAPAPAPVEDAELVVVALDRATALINVGRSDDVKAALDKVGASRVSLLESSQIQEFLDALPCEQEHKLFSDLL